MYSSVWFGSKPYINPDRPMHLPLKLGIYDLMGSEILVLYFWLAPFHLSEFKALSGGFSVSTVAAVSCSSPIWENLSSGYQHYPLKGLNLRYMYCGQNTFLNKLKYINTSNIKWCSYWFVFIFIFFGFKVRYIYRQLMAFFREVIF